MLKIMNLWLSSINKQGTRHWYRSKVSKFIGFLEKSGQGIAPETVDFFLQQELTCTVEGRKGYWRAIRAFTNWASDPSRGYLSAHLLSTYDPRYPKTPRKIAPRKADLLCLLDKMPRRTFAERRNRCYIHTLYYTGLRASDALSIKIKSIDFGRKYANVFIHKTNEFQLISLVNPLFPELLSWIGHCNGDWLFPACQKTGTNPDRHTCLSNMEHQWASFQATQSCWKRINLHMLRHSFGTHARQAGLDLVDIKDLMGHASLAATQIYAVATPEDLLKTANRIWA